VANYNLGQDVPYTKYVNSDVIQDKLSDLTRGNDAPIWELIYNHSVRNRLPAPFVKSNPLFFSACVFRSHTICGVSLLSRTSDRLNAPSASYGSR
jgi:hypothetical protein